VGGIILLDTSRKMGQSPTMFCPRCHRELPDEFRFCPDDGEATVERLDLSLVPSVRTKMEDARFGQRYVVVGFIGRGGMARVYLGEDQKTGQAVAIKVLDRQFHSDADVKKRFLREARAITKVGHENIVEVYEVGLRPDDAAPYLVMEFLFGEPVGRFLQRDGQLPLPIALPALQQAASAIAAAHEVGVIHRDLKPDNLFLIGEPGDPYELKVLDFGFSKLQTSNLTAAGVVLGTPGFMAPEQVLGETVDERTDVYALGMVMHRMIFNRPPFAGAELADDIAMMAHQLHSTPELDEDPNRDPRIDRVVLKAIRKSPEERYPTMAAFDADLRRLTQPDQEVAEVPAGDDRYEAQSKVAGLVAEALARNLPGRR
jgi:serine/threonine-protein kinase